MSQSKESLNSLLCIADSFYELNSIQIPWHLNLDVEQQTVHSKTSSTRFAYSYPRLTPK
ncbi:16193_t:CDS:2, partial [Funneliformis geosporum]